MAYTKVLASVALLAGMAGGSSLVAQDRYWDIHEDRRDLRHDYARVRRMRDDIARDQARLNEAIRCGRDREAAAQAADLARDQRALDYQLRDIRRDRRDIRRDYYRSYYYGY